MLLPKSRVPTHPGEILREEFLVPLDLTPAVLAAHMGVDEEEVTSVVDERAPVTPRLAWLLGMAFDMTPDFWLNLQAQHDLALSRPDAVIAPLPRTG